LAKMSQSPIRCVNLSKICELGKNHFKTWHYCELINFEDFIEATFL